MPSFNPTDRQAQFLENADWLLDTHVGRGTGRTYALAMCAIKLAIRGHVVHLIDPSLVLCAGIRYENHRHFARTVKSCMDLYYPDQEFQFSHVENTFVYMGPRQRDIYGAQNLAPEPVEFDTEDDGSDENA